MHPDLLGNDLQKPETLQGDAKIDRPEHNYYITVDNTQGCWDTNKRETANTDAGQGHMEGDICKRLDTVPTLWYIVVEFLVVHCQMSRTGRVSQKCIENKETGISTVDIRENSLYWNM